MSKLNPPNLKNVQNSHDKKENPTDMKTYKVEKDFYIHKCNKEVKASTESQEIKAPTEKIKKITLQIDNEKFNDLKTLLSNAGMCDLLNVDSDEKDSDEKNVDSNEKMQKDVETFGKSVGEIPKELSIMELSSVLWSEGQTKEKREDLLSLYFNLEMENRSLLKNSNENSFRRKIVQENKQEQEQLWERMTPEEQECSFYLSNLKTLDRDIENLLRSKDANSPHTKEKSEKPQSCFENITNTLINTKNKELDLFQKEIEEIFQKDETPTPSRDEIPSLEKTTTEDPSQKNIKEESASLSFSSLSENQLRVFTKEEIKNKRTQHSANVEKEKIDTLFVKFENDLLRNHSLKCWISESEQKAPTLPSDKYPVADSFIVSDSFDLTYRIQHVERHKNKVKQEKTLEFLKKIILHKIFEAMRQNKKIYIHLDSFEDRDASSWDLLETIGCVTLHKRKESECDLYLDPITPNVIEKINVFQG